MNQLIIEQIVKKVLAEMPAMDEPAGIPVGVSNRHIHLCAEDLETLFGQGYALTKEKDLKQEGEYAAKESVTLVGSKGVLQKVRVLGPIRKFTQIEISRTDGFSLGVSVPVRNSGQIAGSPGIVVAGPKGAVTLKQGLICTARHIHMSTADSACFQTADGDLVNVQIPGLRGGIFANVLVRVHPGFRLEFHIDTDEANAVELKNGDMVTLV